MGTKRFLENQNTVLDQLTGLEWCKDASQSEFPMTWPEAFASVEAMNQSALYGQKDWRIPNRRELFSLISFTQINPALPAGHPFHKVFTSYYWTSTSCSRLPDQAWYVHLGGARVFKGLKKASYMIWPVRSTRPGGRTAVYQTGQRSCFNEQGTAVDCRQTGQDGELQFGHPAPQPRFQVEGEVVLDRLTGLLWTRKGDLAQGPVAWEEAFEHVAELNKAGLQGRHTWRIPSIRELESLVHLETHSPALPPKHPFLRVRDHYWSASSSHYDQAYAWALYLRDGAVGVGFKPLREFYAWAVSPSEPPRGGSDGETVPEEGLFQSGD